jgi:hypothetical protein
MLSISTGAVSHEQQAYDMYPTFWTNDLGTDAILNYDQVGDMHCRQVFPQGIRIPSRQSKTTNSHIQLRITSPSPLRAIQEEVISPKAAVVVAPLPNVKRRFAPSRAASDGLIELVGPTHVQWSRETICTGERGHADVCIVDNGNKRYADFKYVC